MSNSSPTGHQRIDHGFENQFSISASQNAFVRPVRMRHHAENIALPIDDPGDVVQRSIRIRFWRNLAPRIGVTENHLLIVFDAFQRIGVCEEVSFTVSDWNTEQLAFCHRIGKGSVGCFRPQIFKLA